MEGIHKMPICKDSICPFKWEVRLQGHRSDLTMFEPHGGGDTDILL